MAKKNLSSADLSDFEETSKLENEPAETGTTRRYSKFELLDHDLYKLEAASMLKNISYTDLPHLVPVEHCHFFHTIDSTGKKQTTCNQVGGHFHEMIITEVPGKAPTVKCGPAVRYVLKKIGGKLRKVLEVLQHDQHTHEVTYISSEKISPRKVNNEYVKVQALLDSVAPKPVDGVAG